MSLGRNSERKPRRGRLGRSHSRLHCRIRNPGHADFPRLATRPRMTDLQHVSKCLTHRLCRSSAIPVLLGLLEEVRLPFVFERADMDSAPLPPSRTNRQTFSDLVALNHKGLLKRRYALCRSPERERDAVRRYHLQSSLCRSDSLSIRSPLLFSCKTLVWGQLDKAPARFSHGGRPPHGSVGMKANEHSYLACDDVQVCSIRKRSDFYISSAATQIPS